MKDKKLNGNEAFLALQQDIYKNLPKTNETVSYGSTRFEYLDLPGLLSHIMPLLHQHKFVLKQYLDIQIVGDNIAEMIVTILQHTPSGEWNEIKTLLPSSHDMKEWGGHCTFRKRYAIMSLLGISPEADKSENINCISEKQQRLIAARCQNKPHKLAKILEEYGSIDQVPRDNMNSILQWIEKG